MAKLITNIIFYSLSEEFFYYFSIGRLLLLLNDLQKLKLLKYLLMLRIIYFIIYLVRVYIYLILIYIIKIYFNNFNIIKM